MDQDAKKLTLAERIGRILIGIIASFCVLFVLLGILGNYVRPVFLISSALFTGWVHFLERTFAPIEWNWGALAIFVVCLLVIGVMSDYFLKWFSGYVAGKRGKNFIWPTRWTWCGLIATGLFFAVGMSVGGTVHQIGWMSGSKEPMLVLLSRNAGFADMKQVDGALEQALLESKEDYEKARQSVWSYLKHPETIQKRYRMFVVINADGKVTGRVIFPVNQQEFQQTGGLVYIEGETDGGFLPMEKVVSLLQNHRNKLKQF